MSFDTLVIGAGILGLWAARHALKRGETVAIVEKRKIGQGASGGVLGALMPHMPDNWNAKKQLQYDGLTTLEKAISLLEADTGIDCGYRRCGRAIPLNHDKVLPQVERRMEGAGQNWADEYKFEVLASNAFENWLSPQVAAHGIQYDTLSARVSPHETVRALGEYVRPRATIAEGVEAIRIEPHKVTLSNHETISAGRIIVANGWEAYPLLQPWFEGMNSGKPAGRGVKGQAVLVAFDHDDTLPIVYHDGSYLVPHSHNRVAIGSTSVNKWAGEPDAIDPHDMAFFEDALALVPALKDAPIVKRWAGVRPRNTLDGRGTSPWFGPVPGDDSIIALIGGFKITFGLAHLNFVDDRLFTT